MGMKERIQQLMTDLVAIADYRAGYEDDINKGVSAAYRNIAERLEEILSECE